MNTTGIGAAQPFQAVSPFSPHSKPAVGLESPDSKDQTLPPVEESSNADKLRERLGQRVRAADAHDGGADDGATSDQSEQQEPPQASAEEAPAGAEVKPSVPLNATLRPLAIAGADTDLPAATAPAKALDQFQQAAGQTLSPGLLLDQQT